MRRPIPAALIVLFALFSVFAHADDWNKTFAVSGKPDVHVDANDANIEVRAADSKQVEAHVITRGWKIGPGEVRITEHQTGDRVALEVRRPSSHICFGICNQSVRIELSVPREANLDLHTGDGNIRVNDVKGDLHLDSGDGNIEAHSLEGKLNADTHDGNIRAEGRFDALQLHSGDGNIEAEARAGSRMDAGWSLRTGDGRVALRLPADFAADLDAHTGDGRVSVDVPVTVSGSLRENTVRGKMNGGGQPLELRSGDGDIRVEKF